MTDPEHLAMELTAELTRIVLADVIGHGPTRHADVTEFTQAMHRIQTMILSQAAARLYPDRYRLLGQRRPAVFTARPDPGERGGHCGELAAHDGHTWISDGIGSASGNPITYTCDGSP